ncbi:MAG: Nanog homeobox [Candidatus Nomurabacteria bacterium GW2011_GWE2_31_40]|nr:MAG: Nanog homeobox [Candidatus Nomurabacteria bacterium GW2011_GWE2_31_40]
MKKNILKILIIFIFILSAFYINNVSAQQEYNTFFLYINNFVASSYSINNGESVTLSWSSSSSDYSTSCKINDTSSLSGSGNLVVTPNEKESVYTLNCYGYDEERNTEVEVGPRTITINVKNIPVSSPSDTSKLSIQTIGADEVTQTTARLWGKGGYTTTNPTLPITAYFRYSKEKIAPIFCNDIYGTKMKSTKDLFLKLITGEQTFSQEIENLIPDTTYYYCAIISNKNNIAYGGDSIVKDFRTAPLKTIIETKDATQITSTSAKLNGSYNSVKDLKTYFRYKEDRPYTEIYAFKEVAPSWKDVGEKSYTIGNRSNIYGNISFSLSGLRPSTKYIFMATGEDTVKITGSTFSFTTKAAPKNTPYGGDDGSNWGDGSDNGTGWDYCTNGAINYPTCDSYGYTPTCTPPYILNESKTFCIYNNIFPTVILSANPYTISPGDSSTINWTSTNTTSCSFGDKEVKNTVATNSAGKPAIVQPTSSTSYSITCSGPNGTASANAYVYVNTSGEGEGGDGEDDYYNLSEKDGPATITWSSENTTSCKFDGISVGLNGQQRVRPASSTSFSVSCNGDKGTASGNAYIYVDTNGDTDWTGDDGWTNGSWENGTWIAEIWENNTWIPTAWMDGAWTPVSWVDDAWTPGTWVAGVWIPGVTGNNTNNTGNNNTNNTGIINTTPLTLGQKVTPREGDVVRYHEGIETVFTRQIMADKEFAKLYGYEEGTDLQNFAWYLSDQIARMFGYVTEDGREIRVSEPDVAAYQLQLIGNKLTVYEYYYDKIIDIRNTSTILKDASDYEYYFKKR